MGYDRNEVLGRTDLGELADQLVGPHKGRGSGATWPCPDAGHGNQTGKTPPVSVFRTSYGDERWRCHSCGAGGTAIDLVMTTQGVRFPEAIELLARRAGVAEVDRPLPALRTARIQRPEPATPSRPSPEVERFVAAAEAYLWSERGQPMRQWLAQRGLGEDVLRANRVGADPGPSALDRPRGLPRGGPAVVLPVLGADGEATYLQSRYLSPNGHKYDNPSAALAGALPRATEVRLPLPPADPSLVVVSEGIPDALVAAQAGYRTAAVLGAGVPDERTAAALVEQFPTERLVVAFDADGAGQAGAERLQELLAERGAGDRVARLEVPAVAGDLNGWQQLAGRNFGDELAQAMTRTTTGTERSMAPEPQDVDRTPADERSSSGPDRAYLSQGETSDFQAFVGTARANGQQAHVTGSRGSEQAPLVEGAQLAASGLGAALAVMGQPAPLVEILETIRYHHVLLDNQRLAAANVGRVEQAVGSWADPTLPHPTAGLAPAPEMAALDARLDQVAYRHVLVDDPELVDRNLDTLRARVSEWSAEIGRIPQIEPELGVAENDLAEAQRWAFDHGLTASPDLDSPGPELDVPAMDGLAIDL